MPDPEDDDSNNQSTHTIVGNYSNKDKYLNFKLKITHNSPQNLDLNQ
jgi:hypothetical protein